MSKIIIYQELLKEESEILENLNRVRELRKYYEENFNVNSQKSVEDTTVSDSQNIDSVELNNYRHQKTYFEKVYFILKILKETTSKELEIKWLEIDPTLTNKKAKREARRQLWLLADQGLIGKKKSGKSNQNLYFITEN